MPPAQHTSTFRAMLVLALPVLAEESLNLLVGYTDFFLAGRYLDGPEPLAAMGLMGYFLWVLHSLFSFLAIGSLAVVARLVGGQKPGEAAHASRQALLLGAAAAAVGMLVVWFGGAWFVEAMNLRGEAAALAVRYIRILTPAIPFVMLEQVGSACLRGAGDTVSGLLARVALNFVNVVLSTSLVTGWGPFPQLGWDGLAIGTAVGHAVGGTIILWRLVGPACRAGPDAPIDLPSSNDIASESTSRAAQVPSGRRDLLGSGLWRFDLPMARRILRVGVPGGFDLWSVLICHLVYVAIINRLGELAQAAHGLGVQIEAMSYLPGSAFQIAAATLAGQSLGADDRRRAVRGVLLCVVSAMAIMSAAGLVMFFAGERVAIVFTGERTPTAVLVGQLLKIVALSCPFLAVLTVVSGALRGSGDTRLPVIITITGLVGLRIPLACLLAWDEVPLPWLDATLPGFGLGVVGAWWAMVVDVVVRSLLFSARFIHGGWQKVPV